MRYDSIKANAIIIRKVQTLTLFQYCISLLSILALEHLVPYPYHYYNRCYYKDAIYYNVY